MSKFIGDAVKDPVVFMQWKGTDVCMDLSCECGETSHIHGDFAYIVRCPACKKEYEMPCYLVPRPNQRHDGMKAVEGEL